MKLKLTDKIKRTRDVITFVFEPQEKLEWKAGQYLHYVLHHEPTDNRGSDRWFTVSSAPFEKNVWVTTRHTAKKSSSFKSKLFDLPLGKNIEISHLEGDFTVEDLDKDYVFLAGGIGITPFRSILKQLDHENKKIKLTLIYANKEKDNIVFKDELDELSHKNNFKIKYIFSPDHINEETIKFLPDYENKNYYVSGPEIMVESLLEMLRKLEIKEDNLKGDWFPNYPKF